jgi:hypothetical protein
VFGWFDPPVVVSEAGLGADGSDDGVSARLALDAALDDAVQCEAKIFAAQGKESEGVGVAIKGRLRDVEFASDGEGSAPLEEVSFDQFAFGVAADLAFAAVAFFGGEGT